MQFSVLIPVYAKEKYENLEQCLDSVINQTRKPDEIVIVKDGILPDNLEKLINKKINEHKNIEIRAHQIQKNVGVGMASNIGTKLCKHEYIARIDSDDIAVPKRFEIQTDYLEKNKEIDILGGYIEEYNENMKNLISKRIVPIEDKEIKEEMTKRCAINHSTVMYKKSKILEVGNYPDRRTMEDYELWIKCVKKGYQMHNIGVVLSKNRTGDTMYKKRTGKDYIKNIVEIENLLYSLKMISIFEKWYNTILRCLVALIPLKIRRIIYIKLLRKE